MNENEIPEIVGSKDLREVFAAKPVVRGTFFLNRIEIVPLAAAGIASLLEQINRYADKTFVDASVDENYRLVLEARSPAPILIRIGRLLDPTAGQDERNTVLVDLGLPETQPGLAAAAVVHGVAPGPAPEERRRLRLERGVKSGAIPASALRELPNKLAWDPLLNPPTANDLAYVEWEKKVIAEAEAVLKKSEAALDWVKEIAALTQPASPGPEQKQEAITPAPPTSEVIPLRPQAALGAKLPEIGWGGDVDNRGPVGFPS